MRIFVAVDPDPAVRAAAARAARAVADRLAGDPERIRWVAPEQLHVTLRFLGEVADADADAVRAAFRAPFATAAFTARVSRLGCFPPSGAPRVVWLGVGEGRDGMAAVRSECDRRLASAGCPPETRPFRAHITLGRMKGWPARSRRGVDRALSDVEPETPPWRIDQVTLYESRRTPQGARYHVLESTPLAARGGRGGAGPGRLSAGSIRVSAGPERA